MTRRYAIGQVVRQARGGITSAGRAATRYGHRDDVRFLIEGARRDFIAALRKLLRARDVVLRQRRDERRRAA